MINWNYYPKNTRIPDHLNQIIKVFEKNQDNIDSSINQLARVAYNKVRNLEVD